MRLSPVPVVLMALLAACSRQAPMQMAPGTADHTPGRFVWYDLVTNDIPAARAFYGELFDWEFEEIPDHPNKFVLIRSGGIPIGGLVQLDRQNPDSTESQWIGSLSVTNVDSMVERFVDRGGAVLGGPVDIERRGRVAVVSDPQGAVLALVRTENGDPPAREPRIDDWLWQELWTTDGPSALAFYEELFGYQSQTVEIPAGAYHVLQRDGHSYAGLAQLPWDSVPPIWLPYIRVEDPSAVSARVEALGGRVILSPDQIHSRDAAVIEDPTGGTLAIQRWTPEGQAGGGQ